MSTFTNIRDAIVNAIVPGSGGGSAPAAVVTANAQNSVEVNPQISSINYIDTSPIAKAINDFGVKVSGQQPDGLGGKIPAPTVAAPTNTRLFVSLAALGLALYRISKP